MNPDRLLTLVLRLLLSGALLGGCPTADDDDTAADDDASPDDDDTTDDALPPPEDVVLEGPCPLASRFGGFAVEAHPNYTVAQGQASNGVVPVLVLEESLTDGSCTLWKRNNPFCDPACSPGFTCDFDGTCLPYPAPQDLGTVTVEGLLAPVSMAPVPPGSNYFFTGLPLQAMNVGETVRLRSTGGAWAPLELWGLGVLDLDVSGIAGWTIARETPLEVTWPAGAGRAEILFRLNIDQHGLSPSTLECAFPDTGSATVAAAMIDGLFGAGVSGWPSATLSRRTVDRVDAEDGCVDFVVTSPRTVPVSVAGYIPCNLQNPCPDGMTCNLEIELCE